MTVASEQAHVAYIADGRQTRFPLPFTVNSAQALCVAWADDRKRDTFYRPGSDYSIAGNQLLFTHPPPAGRRLTLARADPLIQPTSLAENDRFYAHTIEANFDRLTCQIQRVHELAERCPALPLSSGMRQVTLHPIRRSRSALGQRGQNIVSDGNFGAALLEARDQVLAARTVAATSAALAQQAASLAPAAIAAANQATQAASRAIAAQAIVQAAAERASWALGLMGLANNLTQLLYTVAPFLTRLFGLWKDFGWIDQSVHITVDFGWACMASANRCRDFGLIVDKADHRWDLNLDGERQDWGSIVDQTRYYLPPEPVCLDDLGWINAVLPLNSAQPITLPIRAPDPCPIIFTEPPPPPPPASGAFQC